MDELKCFVLALVCFIGGALVVSGDKEPVSDRIPFALPAHPNAGVLRDDGCVGLNTGGWYCPAPYRPPTDRRVLTIPEWPECSGECID